MMNLSKVLFFLFLVCGSSLFAQRFNKELVQWKFSREDNASNSQVDFDDSDWETVTVPHDWAIYGPFDQEVDKQLVRIVQNNEKKATEKTGRTGALPFIGVGWYRTKVQLPEYAQGKQTLLTFDGAMSQAEVYVNGQKIGVRPYGYSYFYFDISDYFDSEKDVVIAVRLKNKAFSSRWYPGAGLYRKVRLIVKDKVSFKHWGHFITTPYVSEDVSKVNIRSQVQGDHVKVITIIKDAQGNVVAKDEAADRFADEIEQNIAVTNPRLWSPENPYLYTAELKLYQNDVLKDTEKIRFGIRQIKYSATNGFELNGKVTKFKGVCLHHDLGPLGTAVNRAALKRQLTILKDMAVMLFVRLIICHRLSNWSSVMRWVFCFWRKALMSGKSPK